MAEATDNDYTPLGISTDEETPPLDVVIQAFIDAAMRECRVWLPCSVVAVIPGGITQVSVQPTLLRTFPTLPAPVPLPVLQNLLVVYPRGTNYGIKVPVNIGDTGVALFCDRSLDIWKVQGGIVDPQSERTHDISDGVFFPGLYPVLTPPATATATAGPLDMVLYNGLAQLLLQPGGTFMQGNGAIETYAQLVQLLTQLVTLTTDQATSFTAQAAASTGPLLSLAPGFTALALANTTAAAALTLIEAAFTSLMGVPGA